ncbi:sterol 26-hydroxylase, mitochondrial [Erpetoichthys calabaricus]|uniref:Cytochrome P450 family 27 subfamily A member 2 n=1 Tax=Erpetoichthys calabaricus TaxID=27687 RepID=A0A8C4SU34_ERPCA|nr:sterol 26-hydroxylase, mitochondrial [Erpetoichthys calabaricus]
MFLGKLVNSPRALCWHGVRGIQSSVSVERTVKKYKCMEDLPGPSAATTAYGLFVKGYANRSHAMQIEHKKLYGPIWRSTFGSLKLVNVATADLIQQVIQQEGKYPVRTILSHWKEYRDLRKQDYGLHVHTGKEWYHIRSALNPKMLKLNEVNAYVPVVNNVVSDLLRRIYYLREQNPDGTTVNNLAGELYKFGFEGISSILFETRLGCLDKEIPKDTQKFIQAAADMLTHSETVPLFPKWTRSFLPFWKKFVSAWDDMYNVAKSLIDQKVMEIEEKTKKGEVVDGMYLTHLLVSRELSLSEVYSSLMELLLGGVDTTSNTLSWTLYHLARDRAVQEHLYLEVSSLCPDHQIPTKEHLSQMTYMKAVIKEILRLYPVVPGNGRITLENEVILEDYLFPKETQFHLCHYAASWDEDNFPKASEFLPERWLRGPEKFKHHPFSSVPFGVGVRACVGRRVAELEMYLALARLIQHFEFQPEVNAKPVEPRTRTLMIPGAPINMRFISRI